MPDQPDVLKIVPADLTKAEDQQIVVNLVHEYARDPMGNGRGLADSVRRELGPALARHPTTFVLVAYQGDKPIGVAVCFRGFSTFFARPVLNIHDLAVLPEYRGRGIGRALMEAVAKSAAEMDCCTVTLEVFEDNLPARRLYESLGYSHVSPSSPAGGMLFFSRRLMAPPE